MEAESFALVVRALAALLWPASVILAVVLFKTQIRELIGRVAKAKFPGVELDLLPLVKEAEELSEAAEKGGVDEAIVDRLERLESDIRLVASTNPTSNLTVLGSEANLALARHIRPRTEPIDVTKILVEDLARKRMEQERDARRTPPLSDD